jgi:hypothetical protein
VSLHEEKKDIFSSLKNMRSWIMEVEHIFDGSWAIQTEEISNAQVGQRLDAYLERLTYFVGAEERTDVEKFCLVHSHQRW